MREYLQKIPRKYRLWSLLICGTALYFFANIQRVAIPGSVFNLLQKELDVSAPYITAFGSSFMYIYAVCQLGIGLLVDRYGGARVIAFGALIFCIGSLIFPGSDSLFMLYLSRALTGLGASSLYLSLVKEIMRSFNKNFMIMLSVMILIGYAGGIMANAPFVYYINIYGWRNAMIMVAVLSISFYLLFLLAKSTLRMPEFKYVPFSFSPFLSILKKRHNRDLFLFCGINFGLYYVIQTVIGKKFLEDFCSMSSENAAWILSLMGFISAFSGLGFALLSRMSGNRRRIFVRIAGLSCILMFSLISLMLILDLRSTWIAGLLCMLSFTASTSSIVVPLLRETNIQELTGVSVSILNFTCYMVVALLGNAVGLLMNIFPPELQNGLMVYSSKSYLAVFGALMVLAGIVAYCSFNVRETMGENMADSTF